MMLPGFSETDVEVEFTVTFDDFGSQGLGFYVRQNGGVLTETTTPGQGYNIYVEGGFQESFVVWRELDGVETALIEQPLAGQGFASGVPYRIRFQCFGDGEYTRLRGRIWPDGEAEPELWNIDLLDGTPELQDTPGSFAVDMFNYAGTAGVQVDDLVITRLYPY